MPDRPPFSVTVPAFNAQATLAETVESVRRQTYDDWDLVIVDDGSTDGTLELAERLAEADGRIKAIHQENRGSGGAYNTAVRNSGGDLIVMLSADDLLMPDHLASFDEAVRQNPAASVFTSNGWYEYEDGRRELVNPQLRWSNPTGCVLEELAFRCFYGVGAVYRREVFDAVGGFREDLYAEDYLFWLLALAHGFEHRHIDRPLSVHRRSATQKSAAAIRMRETDLRVLTELAGTDLLTPPQEAVVEQSAARLRRNVRVRSILSRAIGSATTERIARWARNTRVRP